MWNGSWTDYSHEGRWLCNTVLENNSTVKISWKVEDKIEVCVEIHRLPGATANEWRAEDGKRYVRGLLAKTHIWFQESINEQINIKNCTAWQVTKFNDIQKPKDC